MEDEIDNFEASIELLEERIRKIKDNKLIMFGLYVFALISYLGIWIVTVIFSDVPNTFTGLMLAGLVLLLALFSGLGIVYSYFGKCILKFIILLKRMEDGKNGK